MAAGPALASCTTWHEHLGQGFSDLSFSWFSRWSLNRSLSSLQFSHSVKSDSLRPHGLQHARPPCLSPTPGVYSNSCPLSRWCHPTISSSVILFSSYLQSFPASGFFQMSQFFTSGGQSIGVSASASVLPMNIQDWFPLGWTGWIALKSMGLARVFSNTTIQKHQFFGAQPSLRSTLTSIHTTGKTIALTRWTFVGKVMSLLFNMLSRLVITFLPRSKGLLISWLQSSSAEKPSWWWIPWHSAERGCNDGSLGAQGAKWLAGTEEELWTGLSEPVAKQTWESCVIREASLAWLLRTWRFT